MEPSKAHYVLDEEDEFYINDQGHECTALAVREFIDGRNTRTVWFLPDGRVGAASDPLDIMLDGVPREHGAWPALAEIRQDLKTLAAEPQISAAAFAVLWSFASIAQKHDLVHQRRRQS